MKKLLLVALLAQPLHAFASYEMALVLDRTAGSIKRYDPISGAYLGSFGTGIYGASAFNLMLDQGTNRVAVGSSSANSPNSTQYFDYNIGNYLYDRTFLYGLSYASKNGAYIASRETYSNTYLLSYDAEGNYLGWVFASGSTLAMVAQSAANRYYAVDMSNGGRLAFWSAMYSTAPTYTAIPNFSSSFGFGGELAVSGNRLAFVSGTGAAGTARLWCGDLSGTGSVTNIRSYDLSSRYQSTFHVTFGHNDDLYIGAQNYAGDGKYRVARYNFTNGGYRGEFGVGGFSDIGGLAFVAAPEPGTWAAMGLGALILLRRRKR